MKRGSIIDHSKDVDCWLLWKRFLSSRTLCPIFGQTPVSISQWTSFSDVTSIWSGGFWIKRIMRSAKIITRFKSLEEETTQPPGAVGAHSWALILVGLPCRQIHQPPPAHKPIPGTASPCGFRYTPYCFCLENPDEYGGFKFILWRNWLYPKRKKKMHFSLTCYWWWIIPLLRFCFKKRTVEKQSAAWKLLPGRSSQNTFALLLSSTANTTHRMFLL